MSFAPEITEQLARARADLRMGVPVVLYNNQDALLAFAAETLTRGRLDDLSAMSGQPVLTITSRRAETLKAHAYDGDVARIVVPEHADLLWIAAVADPRTICAAR